MVLPLSLVVVLAAAPAPAARIATPLVAVDQQPAPASLQPKLTFEHLVAERWPEAGPPRFAVLGALCDGDARLLDQLEDAVRKAPASADAEEVFRGALALLPECCAPLCQAIASRRPGAVGTVKRVYAEPCEPCPDSPWSAPGVPDRLRFLDVEAFSRDRQAATDPWAAAPAQLASPYCGEVLAALEDLAGRDWRRARGVAQAAAEPPADRSPCLLEAVATLRRFGTEGEFRAWLKQVGFAAPRLPGHHVVSVRDALVATRHSFEVSFEESPGVPPEHAPLLADLVRFGAPELKGALFWQDLMTVGCAADTASPVLQVPVHAWFRGQRFTVKASFTNELPCPRPGRPMIDGPESSGADAQAVLALLNAMLERQHSRTRLVLVAPEQQTAPTGGSVVVGPGAALSAALSAGLLLPPPAER